MRALVTDGSAAGGLRLGEVPDPVPGPDQVLIRTAAISLVDRDTGYAAAMLGDGGVWGFDAAGVVVEAAADGSGPPVGSTVLTLLPAPGAWAELVTASTGDVAMLPPGVDPGVLTGLALPAVSAVQALGEVEGLAGSRVLVTGAGAGVGWFAVQLAALRGAEVVAVARDPADADDLRAAGAHEVRTELPATDPGDPVGGDPATAEPAASLRPVDVVVDVVGGSTMTRAVDLLAEGGTALAVGAISGERMVFPPAAFASPLRRRVRGFWGSWPVGGDLATVVELVAAGRLCPRPGWRGGWGEVTGLLESFAAGRTRRRRAVLDVV
ncbi:Alcohol dehydrogenase zinc-binding domain protein [Parafrankia sp. EAN1pec]|uniref:zinc-binding dehydrogenase n=1 Tax=Parafrankia sp. (strain EAN1pec) TaxID=298653 RepID=UPI00005441C5|nr:Alcohol dehydrogenase zinc-binding domain protein [Frankia sp. EAN1pec]